MANRRRPNYQHQPSRRRPALSGLHTSPALGDLPPPVNYGTPFIVLEDEEKNTFVYSGGEWVPYATSIAECRKSCQVKELPQRLNRKVRYEIRCPVDSSP